LIQKLFRVVDLSQKIREVLDLRPRPSGTWKTRGTAYAVPLRFHKNSYWDAYILKSHSWIFIPIRFLWLTLLAAPSASSAYVQYACGASSLPPRYPLKANGIKPVL
jgi:hypothetical protein